MFGGKTDLAPEESKQKSFGLVYRADVAVQRQRWTGGRSSARTPSAPRRADTLIEQYYDLFRDNWIRDGQRRRGGDRPPLHQLRRQPDARRRGGRQPQRRSGRRALERQPQRQLLITFKTKALETLPYSDNLVGKYVRYYNLPIRWKHTLNFGYTRGDWSHNAHPALPRRLQGRAAGPSVANGSYIPPNWKPRVDGYTTYNYSLTWSGIEDIKVTLRRQEPDRQGSAVHRAPERLRRRRRVGSAHRRSARPRLQPAVRIQPVVIGRFLS
jgi:iron complex outermembrane receptor protein